MRRLLGPLLAFVLLAPVAVGTPAPAVAPHSSEPIYSYANAIRETVWVSTGHDLDGDGQPDRVAADIIRPREAEQLGIRVPVLMDTSPYYACCGRGNERQLKTYAADGSPLQFPLFYDNYFVPRGYAVVLVDEAGTNRSSGCPSGPDATGSSVAVIDWVNGRGHGFDAPFGGRSVRAGWSTGAVGMFGKSNDAQYAIDTAATGVDGLKTIVSIAGPVRAYDIFNADGAWFGFTPNNGGPPGLLNDRAARLCKPVLAAEDAAAGHNGDYNEYWRHVDSLRKVGNMHASVFAVQGFADQAVLSLQFGKFWNALAQQGIERKAWLHQAGHVDPFDLRRASWVRTVHAWFDHYLLGIDNGIERQPRVDLETSADRWKTVADWPAQHDARTLYPTGGGSLVGAHDAGTAQFTDDPEKSRFQWAKTPAQPQDDRVLFRTPALAKPLPVAGSPTATITVRSSLPRATVGVELVDYGPATVRDDLGPGAGIRTLTTRSCWGESTTYDSACFLDTATDPVDLTHEVLAAGWADVGHDVSLTGAGMRAPGKARYPWLAPQASLAGGHRLDPARYYTVTVDLTTLDHTVPAGHRLGLVIGGTDAWMFVGHDTRPTLTVDLSRTSVSV